MPFSNGIVRLRCLIIVTEERKEERSEAAGKRWDFSGPALLRFSAS